MSIDLQIQKRNGTGKKIARKLRHEQLIPGIIYGDNKEPMLVAIGEKELLMSCYSLSFFGHIIDVKLDGKAEKVLPRDISFDVVTGMPLHVDFQRIAKGAKIKINVPVEFENEDKSPGMKKGGVVNFVVHTLECLCPADSIPEKILIDMSGKDLGYSFTLDQVDLPAGVEPSHPDRDHIIATIVAPRTGAAEESTSTEAESEAAAS